MYREQIAPTEHLLSVCQKVGAKLTIYFEYGQYRFFDKYSCADNDYQNSNLLIRQQLKKLVSLGHDVQLHLHPTWLNAELSSKGEIELNIDACDICNLDKPEIVGILKEGKEFLEGLLKPINADYECIAFRAGAWTASNHKLLIQSLYEAGFKVDSSVAKYAHMNSSYGSFDYRDCEKHTYWFVSDNLSKVCSGNTESSILELPILGQYNRFAPLLYLNRKRRLTNRIVRKYYTNKITDSNLSRVGKLRKVLNRDFVMADFNFIAFETLNKMIKAELLNNSDKNLNQITLIGHSKTSYFNDELLLLLEKIKDENNVVFDTVSTFYRRLGDLSR
ncbi:hypothetical protein BCT05_06885 [Vibrio breoganii]|uniref:hypothetical protein n=1 Tax=Vibrio breoganii TaxID=553239 RepID=UPI000C846099|nr:hypothetical protein [Vibrio breoganii]PMO67496.1 hypothetical protein BCT05_06885 [Vibrio breoganii]